MKHLPIDVVLMQQVGIQVKCRMSWIQLHMELFVSSGTSKLPFALLHYSCIGCQRREQIDDSIKKILTQNNEKHFEIPTILFETLHETDSRYCVDS
jgi:hypothetical protein